MRLELNEALELIAIPGEMAKEGALAARTSVLAAEESCEVK